MSDRFSFISANQTPSVLVDSTGKIMAVNHSLEKLLDIRQKEFTNKWISDFFPSLDLFQTGSEEIEHVSSGNLVSAECRNNHKSYQIQVNELIQDTEKLYWLTFTGEKNKQYSLDNAEFIKKLIKSSRDVIAFFDEDFNCKFISSACKDLIGYDPVEIYRLRIPDILHPEDQERFRNEHMTAIRDKKIHSYHKVRLKKKSGEYIWVNGNHHREFDEAGNYRGVIVNLVPYQEEIETKRKLQHESEKFKVLTESISDIVTWLDNKGEVLYQSPSLKEILGYEPEEFKNINEVNNLIHPDDLREFKASRQRFSRQKRENYTISYRIRDNRGNFHYFESHVRNILDEAGKIRNIVFTSRDLTNRFKKEQQLKESQVLYQYLADHSNDVIIRLDETNHITYISPSCLQLAGYYPDEIVADDFFQSCIHPEDLESFNGKWKSSLRKREDLMVSRLRILHKKGHPVWVEFVVKREFDSRGLLKQSIANLRDISERIRDQVEVEKIKERYQLAVEAGHTGIWDYTFENQQMIIDNSLKNLLGYEDKHEINEDYFWEKVIYSKDREPFRMAVIGYTREKKTYFEETVRMVHKRNISLWVLCRGKIFYNKNKPTRIICSVTDITERKESNEKLRKALINFKAVFDAFPDLFFRVNRMGDFLEIMAGDSATFGISNVKELEEKNLKDAFPSSEYYPIYDSLQRAFDTFKVESCEYSLSIRDEIKYYEARIIAITDNEAIGIVRDSTEAVKTNRELIKAKQIAEEAVNAKDEFLSMMSHEIRTPLNVVVGMIYLLMEQDPKQEQLKFINALKFSADNLLSLINDLLDFSKIRAGKVVFEKSDFRIREFIKNIYDSYNLQLDRSKINLKLGIDEKIPEYVVGDYNRLAQILNNLLSNAHKFTKNGEIGISLRLKEIVGDLAVVNFIISDTGIGITKEKLNDIFEPFSQGEDDTTRKYGGTGLGLTIVKQLIELQNGDIQVESEYGKGSVFTVTLPLVISDKKADEQAVIDEESVGNRLKGIRLLFADDVSSNRFLMKGYADLWNFELQLASNGKEALEYFNEETYDVILLDLQMPEIDGFETARRIREMEKAIGVYTPILAVTGDISEQTVSKIFSSGIDDYLLKPVNPGIMMNKIRDLLKLDNPEKYKENGLPESDPDKTDDKQAPLDLSQVDYLYGDVPAQYSQFLSMLIKEFRQNKQLLLSSLREENFDEFRRIRHSMRSGMKLLKMENLQELMENIREAFIQNDLPASGGDFPEELSEKIDTIISLLEDKIKILTSQD